MTDIVDKPTRSRMMAGIKGGNTRPELSLRRTLHARGFRFRLHVRTIPGKPDVVFPKYRAVIFVHGCFWHRHSGCQYAATPSTRAEFWQKKFEQNMARDAKVRGELKRGVWRVAILWECALRNNSQIELAATRVSTWLRGSANILELGPDDLHDGLD